MLKALTQKGELKNVRVNDNGELIVENGGNQEFNVSNTNDNPVPVKITENIKVTQTYDQEVVLNASVLKLSTENTVIELNKKVTVISIANYSEADDITITIGENAYQIGAKIAADLPINKVVDNITLVSTAEETKIQLIIKGVE